MLKEWLSKLFKRKKVNTTEIISILDLVDIPTREYIENENLLKAIDEYKKEYLKIINNKKFIVHTDFNMSPLKEEMLMNFNLIFNTIYGNKIKIYADFECQDVDVKKLQIYKSKINELELEVIARINALKEIYEEKKAFMLKYRKERILNEISILKAIHQIFLSHDNAVEKEKNSYLLVCEEKESSKEKLLLKLERVEDLAKTVIPERLKLLEDIQDIRLRIAFIERELEIYAYKNKDKALVVESHIDDIGHNLQILNNQLSEHSVFDEASLEEQFQEIQTMTNLLEKECLVFALYGRNLITDKILNKLYDLKFAVLTFNINYYQTPPINEKTNVYEHNCYTKKLSKIVENIITGKNEFFNSKFDKNIKKAIILFKDIIMTNGIFNMEEILNNPEKLAFILSFQSNSGLYEYYENFDVPKSKYNINYFEGVFRWADNLPLDTIYKIRARTIPLKDDPCLLFYNMAYEKLNEITSRSLLAGNYSYHFPEGLIEFVDNVQTGCNFKSVIVPLIGYDFYRESDNEYMIRYIKEKIEDKQIMFPKSFKVGLSLLFNSASVGNEYSKNKTSVYTSFGKNIDGIVVPSIANLKAVLHICEEFLEDSTKYKNSEYQNNRENIYFYDFKNSRILNTPDYLHRFVTLFFYVKKIPYGNGHPKFYEDVVEIISCLKKIVFLDEDFNEVLTIDVDELIKILRVDLNTYKIFAIESEDEEHYGYRLIWEKIEKYLKLAQEKGELRKRVLPK